jgi:hypothetical protein
MSSTRPIRARWALSPAVAASALMVLAVCVLAVRLVHLYADIRSMPADVFGDFNYYLYAFTTILNHPGDASLLYDRDGLLAFLESMGVQRGGPGLFYGYPPQFALVFSVFGYLPPLAAKLTWVVCSALLFAAGVGMLIKLAYRGSDGGVRLLFVAMALASCPLMIDISLGQSNELLFFLIVATFFFVDRGNRALAGVFLGTAIVLKVTPIAIGGLLLMRREWRTAIVTALTSMAITAFTAWKVGVHTLWHYLVSDMPRLNAQNLKFGGAPDNNSLRGAVQTLAEMAGIHPSESTLHTVWLVTAAIACVMAVVLVFRRHADRRIDFALAVTTMLVASPMLEPVHLLAALIPLAILLGTAFEHPGLRVSALAPRTELALIALTVLTMIVGPHTISYVVAILIVYVLCLARYVGKYRVAASVWHGDFASNLR